MRKINKDELKDIQLHILEAVDAFCHQNGIQYFLFAGSLIGAVRHKGYIPWDDDIDICMKRADYERFMKAFHEQTEYPQLSFLCFEKDPQYYLASGKVIDNRTVMIEKTNLAYPIGVYVDVFPLDDLPADEKKIRALDKRMKKYRDMQTLKLVTSDEKRSYLKNAVLNISEWLLKPVKMPWILQKIISLAQTYRNCSGEMLADISVFTYGMREVFPAADFNSACKLEFEGRLFDAPIEYEDVLTRMYGDYQKLPPKEKQVSHHVFEAYWKEQP